EGKLIRRIHTNLSRPSFKTGLAAFCSGIDKGGIDQFLSQAQRSPNFGELHLRAAISQIVIGGYFEFDGNIEDRMSHIFRALDALCEKTRAEKAQEPPEYLGENVGKEVLEIITEAKNKIQ